MASSLPPIPNLAGHHHLCIFTDESLGDEEQSNARYIELGKAQVPAALSFIFFNKTPTLKSSDIALHIEKRGSIDQLCFWSDGYRLLDQLRCVSEVKAQIVQSKERKANLFHALAGGIVAQYGPDYFTRWMSTLLEEPVRIKTEEPIPPGFGIPKPSSPPPTMPGSPQLAGKTTLQYLNEIAAQRRIPVEWLSSSYGPPHAPTWAMVVKVNGQEVSRASGPDKKAAKETAAREAIAKLGW